MPWTSAADQELCHTRPVALFQVLMPLRKRFPPFLSSDSRDICSLLREIFANSIPASTSSPGNPLRYMRYEDGLGWSYIFRQSNVNRLQMLLTSPERYEFWLGTRGISHRAIILEQMSTSSTAPENIILVSTETIDCSSWRVAALVISRVST